MKWNLTGFRRRWMAPLMLALGSVPLMLLAHCLWFPADKWLWPLFPAMYLLMSWLCLLLGGKLRLPVGVLCGAGLLYAGYALMPWQGAWQMLLVPFGTTVLLFFTLPIAGWPEEREPSYVVWYICVVAYLFAQACVILDVKGSVYKPIEPILLISFLLFGGLQLMSMNRQSLSGGAAKGRGLPLGMKRKNKLLTIGLMALILLVAAIPAIKAFLEKAWNWLVGLVLLIWEFILSLIPTQKATEGSGGGDMDMVAMFGEGNGPSALAVWMEKVLRVVVVIVIVLLLVWVGRFLWRKLKKLLIRLWDLLTRYAHSASEDYVDEVADTREDGGDAVTRRSVFSRLFQQVNEDRLNPVERIRYRYGRLMHRHAEWQPGSTARENLPSEQAILYERARYSTEEITPEEAEAFAQASKAMEKKNN